MELPVLKIENLKKDYIIGTMDIPVLMGISFEVFKGEFVSIMGPSGCGKSTLMNLIGCLDTPTSGKIYLDGANVSSLTDKELAEIRNKKIGFVFQMFNLLPRLTAAENVELPLIYSGKSLEKNREKVFTLLENMGIKERAYHKPKELSGGQTQRVAIARALINSPSLLLADEPTGNLDSKSSVDIMRILQELNDKGMTIILVTHDHDVANYTKRKISLKDGAVIEDIRITQVKL